MKYTLSPWLCLSFFSYFFLSLSLGGLGVSCNTNTGFSLVYPVTWSSHLFLFLCDPFSYDSHVSLPLISSLSSSVSLSSPLTALSVAFPEPIISVFAMCLWQGSLAGRKAGWWPLRSGVDSGPVQAVPIGARVSDLCDMPENTHPLSYPSYWLHVLRKDKHQAFERTCVGLARTILHL